MLADAARVRLAVLLVLPLAGDPFSEGLAAYRAGAFKDAYRAFAAAATDADAPPQAHYNQALAALRAGLLRECEEAAGKAARLAGGEFVAGRDFLRGSAAFARAQIAQGQASGPEAEPFAFDVAIAQAETAVRAFQAAAMSRDDWPEARRNVERALALVDELQRKKAEAEAKQQNKTEQAPKEQPEPEPPSNEAEPEPALPDEQAADLAPELVARMWERLMRKEAERRKVRVEVQTKNRARVEQDW